MLPIQFEYMHDLYFDGRQMEKRHVTLLSQFKQHYTGETIYRVRIQLEHGYVFEDVVPEHRIKEMLKTRVRAEA